MRAGFTQINFLNIATVYYSTKA